MSEALVCDQCARVASLTRLSSWFRIEMIGQPAVLTSERGLPGDYCSVACVRAAAGADSGPPVHVAAGMEERSGEPGGRGRRSFQ